MRFSYFLFLIASAGIISCTGSQDKKNLADNGYQITGKIDNLSDNEIILYKLENNSWKGVDTTQANDKNEFVFQGKVKESDFYLIGYDKEKSLALVLDNISLKVSADANDPQGSPAVKGSSDNDDLYVLLPRVIAYNDSIQFLKAELERLETEEKSDSLKAVLAEIDAYKQSNEKWLKNFADSIMPSMAVFKAIQFLDPYQNTEYLNKLAIRMKKEMPDAKYTQQYATEITRMAEEKRKREEKMANSKVSEGKKAPDFALTDPEGNEISLSDLQGKYVLLDFWASWCNPCRQENPNLVKAYQKFNKKNFEIFSVSLDQKEDAWLRAIKKDNMTWKHASDLGGWQSSVVPKYELEGIPATFLLDPEGNIIARDLRGDALEKKLEEVLK
ncbi:TlpA disulfide reductase family protein [Cytophagaceae bacterium ABcell3]|nr:TlpA disulfide reductase family protein [Cytophagaceae bacterium ABcell3]